MSALLDTNIPSERLRAQPHSAMLARFAEQSADSLFVSVVKRAKTLLGAWPLPRSRRRQQLETALVPTFREDLADRDLPFDSAAAAAYAAAPAGWPISQFDARIAGIALSRRAGLATCNVFDFEDCGLALTDPWSAS